MQPEDGKIPFSEAGLALANQIQTSYGQLFGHVEQWPPAERCIGGLGSPPIRPPPFVLPFQIVQNREHVVIYTEDATGLRIINLSDSDRPQDDSPLSDVSPTVETVPGLWFRRANR